VATTVDMGMSNCMKCLIWDFDGTLAYRDGMWTGTLLEVIRQQAPDYHATADEIRPFLQTGFPWHVPDQPHPEICSGEQWWNSLDPVFQNAFEAVGFPSSQARLMAKQVRHVYPTPEKWRLFEDTIPALNELSSRGWTHFALSNHVPELRRIICHLGLGPCLSKIFNSAETGYEKPHPQAFRMAIEELGEGSVTWMIGDSMTADIVGAESVGLSGLLVRKHHEGARYFAENLTQVAGIVHGSASSWVYKAEN